MIRDRFRTFYSRCDRCSVEEFNIITGFFHDLRCWGLNTALFNLWCLLLHPEDDYYVMDE